MPEQFANLAETTLSANYTAGQGFIAVTSTSGFPTLPTFRVRLGNASKTVFRVDWVYGTRFYGVAEANDGSGTNGDAVTIVISAATLNRFLQSPDTGFLSDRIFMPTGALAEGQGGYGPVFKMGNANVSTWTWRNATNAAFVQTGGGLVKFVIPQTSGSTSFKMRNTSIPARPYRVTAGFIPNLTANPNNISQLTAVGLVHYEVASTKGLVFMASNFDFSNGNQPPTLVVHSFSNPTTATTLRAAHKQGTDWYGFDTVAGGIFNFPVGRMIWLRITDDNVNLKYEYSWDRLQWNLLTSLARTTGFTTAPDELGLVFFAQSCTLSLTCWLVSWDVETPSTPSTGALKVTGQAVTRTP